MCCNRIPSKGLIAVGISNMVLGSLLLLTSIVLPIIFSLQSFETYILGVLGGCGAFYSVLVLVSGICAYFGGKKSQNINDTSNPGFCHIIAALVLSIIVLILFVAIINLSTIFPLTSLAEGHSCPFKCELIDSLKGNYSLYCSHDSWSYDCTLYISGRPSYMPFACQRTDHSDFYCEGWGIGTLAIIQAILALFIFGFSMALSIMGCCSVCCRQSHPVVFYPPVPYNHEYTTVHARNQIQPIYAIPSNQHGVQYLYNPPNYAGNHIPAFAANANSDMPNETPAGPLPEKI